MIKIYERPDHNGRISWPPSGVSGLGPKPRPSADREFTGYYADGRPVWKDSGGYWAKDTHSGFWAYLGSEVEVEVVRVREIITKQVIEDISSDIWEVETDPQYAESDITNVIWEDGESGYLE